MDEFSSLISLPFKLGNLITEDSITLFPKPSMTKLPLLPAFTFENKNSNFSIPLSGFVKIESKFDKSENGEDNFLVGVKESGSCIIFSNAFDKKIEEDDQTGLMSRPLAAIVDSHYTMDDAKSFGFEKNHFDEIENGTINRNIIKKSDSWVSTISSEVVEDLSVEKTRESVPKRTFSASLVEVSQEKEMIKHNLSLNAPPLWGSISICGRRAEMEDSIVALPRFLSIPAFMLSERPVFTSVCNDLTGHVFGVYDGHGGYQQWLEIFRNCFRKLDDEVGGFSRDNVEKNLDFPVFPIAPDSVGSTAVVAIVCNSHIIVANCGDSRAVLNRGKVSVPLSVDHRPNRGDECARIEGLGGKVINWDGHRVSGVLAVSRSIGDRYLRPYVIADPELMIVPRTKEDECLILASDGLWDVMTNNEACDLARKRILLWHKKNGPTLPKERGHGVDPAAHDAADYLSRVGLQRGSRDNISVVVVDLKAQRKFKRKM
ncbi:protein phosphatase 2c [Striga asiatica]|uniref:protein-serine/threonine phosphatase n=1 Tax=Striga asiatica TaxID=4170 RepID=A0A5A7PW81_STRAF|nr:protein phosphatase 2c [Striga asiatica]